MAAAAELVREHGPAAFSMREAARRVGVDPATCYRHFKDRHALLMAIAQSGFEELARRMGAERRRRSRSSPRVRLIALGPVYLGYALEQPAYFRVMFGESGTTARDQRLRLPSVQRSAYEQLEDELTLWAEAEGLRADVPRLALKLWAGMHGLARLAIDGAVPLEKGELRRLGEEIGEAIVDAAVADAGGPRRGARRPSDRGR